ncbi:MAG: ribose-phosphate pyrophosphokinase [Oscillospiraceae bacterium]|jgi:ribose-phosphate pyrophosphokinase|nr:ribose-phosphate pyrophosphokinase [Oscillospiraceae bacterium]
MARSKDIKIICGNSNKPFAENVCRNIGLRLGNATVSTFSDGEIAVSLNETVRGSDVFIIQATCTPINDNLMEMLIMVDACKRASASRITCVMPYFGYARQDRKAKARDPISAKLVANLITSAGTDRVLSMDLHAAQIQGFFDIPVDNLIGAPLFVDYYTKKFKEINDESETIIVSPDIGSVARARAFALKMGLNLAIIDKRREKANQAEVMNIIGSVEGKRVILFDDMVDTAGSLCEAASALVEIGGASEIYACASHGVLSGKAIERIEQSIVKEVIFSDTVPFPEGKSCDKIKYLSATPLFAEAINRIFEEVSISTLFR